MSTNIRSNFADLFGPGKLPELEAIIMALEESYMSMIPILFNETPMSTDIYQTTTISGLENPKPKPENSPVAFQSLKGGFKKTYTATTFAAGYRISKEAKADGKFDFIQRATKSFAKGFFEIEELAAASVFDDGFTVQGYDGVPLFSTQHPLENAGGFGINRPAVASPLTVTSYRELRNILQDTVNENGQLLRMKAQYLVVPQGLQDTAKELVGSSHRPDNANNAINTIFTDTQVLPGSGFWNYLQNDTSFYMTTDKMEHHLMFMRRQDLEVDADYDRISFAHEVIASKRFDKGYSNWRGVVGNPGI